MNIFKRIYKFGDKIEDKVRGKLSHFPIIYAFIGGAGVIIFWRGIWHTVDYLMEFFTIGDVISSTSTSFSQLPWWDGPLSIVFGALLLLITGLFVASFIGNEIVISGLKGEKKITEKTEEEVVLDVKESVKIKEEIHEIDERIKHIETILSKEENENKTN
jgi:MFS superfamily sulfate permease-like transporter